MQISKAIEFVAERKNAMLLAIKSDGRPQSSNVVYVVNDAGQILISVTEGRAKTKNLRRDLRASLHVNRDNFWAMVDDQRLIMTLTPTHAYGMLHR